jgi:3-dehydroquinate synthetase
MKILRMMMKKKKKKKKKRNLMMLKTVGKMKIMMKKV